MALLLVGGSLPSRVHGAISCTTNKDCEESLGRVGSICLEDSKTCSNPFQRGCLNILLPKEHELSNNIRVCNSDDILPDAIQLRLCYQPDFQYEELRIHNVSVFIGGQGVSFRLSRPMCACFSLCVWVETFPSCSIYETCLTPFSFLWSLFNRVIGNQVSSYHGLCKYY